MADFYDYSTIDFSNTTLDQVLTVVREANDSGEILDSVRHQGFMDRRSLSLS
jgi:hypothetical protein